MWNSVFEAGGGAGGQASETCHVVRREQTGASVLAPQRMRELEEKGKREEEEFRKRMEDMRAERTQLEANMLTHDANARQKMDEANLLAKD